MYTRNNYCVLRRKIICAGKNRTADGKRHALPAKPRKMNYIAWKMFTAKKELPVPESGENSFSVWDQPFSSILT